MTHEYGIVYVTSLKRSSFSTVVILSFRLNPFQNKFSFSTLSNALVAQVRLFRAGSSHAAAWHGANELVAHLVILGAARAPRAPVCSGGGFLREYSRPQDPPCPCVLLL